MRAVTKRNIFLCVCVFFFLRKKGVIPLGLNETRQFFSLIPAIYTLSDSDTDRILTVPKVFAKVNSAQFPCL